MKDNKQRRSAAPAEKPKTGRFGFSWWMKNVLIAALVYMLCPSIVRTNAGYDWLINGYAKSNLAAIQETKDFNTDQRLEARLGYDYAFIEMIRKSTPETAVVFYPSRADFTDTTAHVGITFSGNLCDKLSAVRFLYPRRVVVKEELGKTSWSKRLTHVAIVNGRWRELLPYKVPEQVKINVLPMDSVAAMTMFSQQNQ